MVFCNTVPSCDWVAHHLSNRGLVAVKLHGNVPIQVRWEQATSGWWMRTLTGLSCTRSEVRACSGSGLETAEF